MEVRAMEAMLLIREEIEEVEHYKWLESEKQGRDIGGNQAALEWLDKHQEAWQRARG
jgi:hypothetical protein